jgi:Domain of unknown function (DUF5668)
MNGNNPSLMCAIRGPIMLITIGTLFAIDHLTEFSIARTWPTILIVLGLLKLGDHFSSPGSGLPSRRDPDAGGGQ